MRVVSGGKFSNGVKAGGLGLVSVDLFDFFCSVGGAVAASTTAVAVGSSEGVFCVSAEIVVVSVVGCSSGGGDGGGCCCGGGVGCVGVGCGGFGVRFSLRCGGGLFFFGKPFENTIVLNTSLGKSHILMGRLN